MQGENTDYPFSTQTTFSFPSVKANFNFHRPLDVIKREHGNPACSCLSFLLPTVWEDQLCEWAPELGLTVRAIEMIITYRILTACREPQ